MADRTESPLNQPRKPQNGFATMRKNNTRDRKSACSINDIILNFVLTKKRLKWTKKYYHEKQSFTNVKNEYWKIVNLKDQIENRIYYYDLFDLVFSSK